MKIYFSFVILKYKSNRKAQINVGWIPPVLSLKKGVGRADPELHLVMILGFSLSLPMPPQPVSFSFSFFFYYFHFQIILSCLMVILSCCLLDSIQSHQCWIAFMYFLCVIAHFHRPQISHSSKEHWFHQWGRNTARILEVPIATRMS